MGDWDEATGNLRQAKDTFFPVACLSRQSFPIAPLDGFFRHFSSQFQRRMLGHCRM